MTEPLEAPPSPWPEPVRARPGTAAGPQPASLADVLERVLDKGIVIVGDIRINLVDIELLTIKLRLLVASVDRAREMGIDWWQYDPMLSSRARERARDRELDREPEGGREPEGDRALDRKPKEDRALDREPEPEPERDRGRNLESERNRDLESERNPTTRRARGPARARSTERRGGAAPTGRPPPDGGDG